MLILVGGLVCLVAGFVVGLMYAKTVKSALGAKVDG